MSAKRKRSVHSSPRDGAPEITKEWVAGADLRRGTKLVRRGRPPTNNPKQLLSLRLPPEGRAALAKDLIESLELAEADSGSEAAWIDEIESRADAFDRGETTADDWKESLDRVRKTLREGRKA